ncbi:MAG: hypothetical protein HY568_00510 [Candidatus Latescibacteria bacterium]|nr:hypothetical protein [Candidatus Latescibacterota bacterium]
MPFTIADTTLFLIATSSLGIGLSVSNTRAVLEALAGERVGAHRDRDGLYFAWTMVSLAHAKLYAPLAFFLLYLFGFLYVGVMSLVHASSRS